ncbi:hypothetical protein J7E70_15950 [Variovorax paradoxus]|nr:DUF4286 family protein [Variovorax paradoxus]MBT2301956.1 hypothetical protein [Variovorax paradoxus]
MTRRALLINWFDLPAEHEADFDTWHNREHVIERVTIPGFVQGRRFVAIGAPAQKGHGYLVIYDAQDLQALQSPAYEARLDGPTPLTRRVVPMLRELTRTAGEVVQERGAGNGVYVRTLRLPGLSTLGAQTDDAVASALDAAYACNSVTAVQLYRPDVGVTHFKDRTQEGRATDTLRRDDYPWGIVVEACRPAALDAATEALRARLGQLGPDAATEWQAHSYQLVFAMDADQAHRAVRSTGANP